MAERQPVVDINNGEQIPNVNELQGVNVRNVASPVAGIIPPQALCIDANETTNWKLFKQKWDNYTVIAYLNRQPVASQTALLLHTLGDEAPRVYNVFRFITPEDQRTSLKVIQAFDSYAVGETNETYERFVFHMRKQERESVEAYIAALRTLLQTCNFCDNCVNSVLHDIIMLGIRNRDIQSELLKVRNLELQVCIDTCKMSENAAHQSRALRPETMNKLNAWPRNKPFKQSKAKPEEKSCKYCTSQH